jgi:hypothetical protein
MAQQQPQQLGGSVGDAIARPYDVIARVFEAHATADIAAPVSAEFARLLDLGAGDRSPHLAQVCHVCPPCLVGRETKSSLF